MKNDGALIGMMIKKYRLEQNMSQEALCTGICAVSYLSKIEKGTVVCSQEILSKLLDVLGITIPEDSELLKPYEQKIEQYFKHFFFSNNEQTLTIFAELRLQSNLLKHSYLFLDMMLVESYNQLEQIEEKTDLTTKLGGLWQYHEYMTDIQGYRFYLLLGMYEIQFTHDYLEGLRYFKLAQNIKRDGITLTALASSYYLLGNYLESITLGNEAYGLLMEEGNINWAIDLCFTISASYANSRNINKTLYYYNRILTLTEITRNFLQQAYTYYNIGATYLVKKDYNQAKQNLSKSYDLSKHHRLNSNLYLLLLQKLFLSHVALNEKDKAEVYLNLAIESAETVKLYEINQSTRASLDWIKIMYSDPYYLQNEKYLQSIKRTYELSLKDSHHGFHIFYGNYLIEAYKKQRKYKEALKITEALYVKDQFS